MDGVDHLTMDGSTGVDSQSASLARGTDSELTRFAGRRRRLRSRPEDAREPKHLQSTGFSGPREDCRLFRPEGAQDQTEDQTDAE